MIAATFRTRRASPQALAAMADLARLESRHVAMDYREAAANRTIPGSCTHYVRGLLDAGVERTRAAAEAHGYHWQTWRSACDRLVAMGYAERDGDVVRRAV